MKKISFLLPVTLLAVMAVTLISWSITGAISGLSGSKAQRQQRFESFLASRYLEAPHPVKDKSGKLADNPDAAALQEYLMTLDPATGTVPRERLLEAFRETRRAMAEKDYSNSLEWQGYGSDMGGRTRAIMYDPNDASHQKVWAGGVTGGLWYNDHIQDAFSPWIPAGDFWPVLAIRCITYDPDNTQTFYVGTGEAETAMTTYRESSGLGQGIWRSNDGGQTWAQIPSTAEFAYITDILVRKEGSVTAIYAGVCSGLYHGTHQSLPTDGLYRSTDNGNTWEQVLPDITGSDVPYAVSDIDQNADGRMFVGTRPNLDGQGAAAILYSDTGLPGTWVVNEDYQTEIQNDPDYPIPGRVVLAAAKSNSSVVYALIASGYQNPENNFNYFYCFYILRSADGGVTWTKKPLPWDITSGFNFATIAWHALDIAVDPNDANHLYIGGLDVHQSMSGGDYWDRVSDWSLMYGGGGPQYIHADQHTIVFKPGSSSEILFGCDGGVFFTSNGSSAAPVFEEHNNSYGTLQFYSADIQPTSGTQVFLGGLQDNGCLYYTGTPLTIFDMVSGGDGAYCFFDENEPNLSISSLYYNQYYIFNYGSYINGLFNWSSGTFVSPAAYDYRRNAIYANAVDFLGNHADQLLRLSDITGAGTGTFINLNTGSSVCFSAVTYSPYSTNSQANLFVGNQAGRLFRVVHAESTPVVTEITGSNFPSANISDIAVGGSEDTLLVTFSNYGVVSVFLSTDGGQSWQDKEGNLPDMPVRWALFHPDDSKHVLLATETGVWATDNLLAGSVSWQPAVTGMANVRTDMLRIRKADNTVIAASHGRGLFTAIYDISTGIGTLRPDQASVYPNPTSGAFTVSLILATGGTAETAVTDLSGHVVASNLARVSPGTGTLQADISGREAGTYLVTVRLNGKIIHSSKVVKL
jgi:photosystem II stability/assembly factor-like uncharacterized protein